MIHSTSRSDSTRCTTPTLPLASAAGQVVTRLEDGRSPSLTLTADFVRCIQSSEAEVRVLQLLVDPVLGDPSRLRRACEQPVRGRESGRSHLSTGRGAGRGGRRASSPGDQPVGAGGGCKSCRRYRRLSRRAFVRELYFAPSRARSLPAYTATRPGRPLLGATESVAVLNTCP